MSPAFPFEAFDHSSHSAFQPPNPSPREVEDLKSRMQHLCQFLIPTNNGQDNMQSLLNALSQSFANINQQMLAVSSASSTPTNSRKRPALTSTSTILPQSSVQPPQPECPVALRPVPLGATIPSNFIPGWPWLLPPPIPAGSPTLPVSLTEPHIDPSKQWSSPSSVESGQKTDSSSSGETSHIDPVGVDSSESSSTSSTSTLAMLTSPSVSAAYANFALGKMELSSELHAAQAQTLNKQPALPHERKIRKQISDDYVKLIRNHDLSGKKISDIQIPVKQALEADPSFRAVSEQQIVQQIMQSKRFEDMDVRESMTQLCKKLAEKRVFGARLMAQTTVAGPNHSTYSNLPDEGIIYIQVLFDRLGNDDEVFWEMFRDAMRKLAARCRRVRHAKKTRTTRDEQIATAEIMRSMSMQTGLHLPASRTSLLLKHEALSPPASVNGFLTS